MITSSKNYTKKKKTPKTDRTLGQTVKAKLYRQITQRRIYIHTHKKKKGKKIYISIYIKKRKKATKSINKCTNDNKL